MVETLTIPYEAPRASTHGEVVATSLRVTRPVGEASGLERVSHVTQLEAARRSLERQLSVLRADNKLHLMTQVEEQLEHLDSRIARLRGEFARETAIEDVLRAMERQLRGL